MREIKFRVWDGNVMYRPEDNETELGLWNLKKYVVGGYLKHKNNVLMLCTGLKDSEGKEIYEGDVVLGTMIFTDSNGYDTLHKDYRGIVRYCNGYATFAIKENIKSPLENYFNFLYQYDFDDIKVIGNIYENEDLLHKNAK